MLEHVSLALNPRGALYKTGSLIQVTMSGQNEAAIEAYRRKIDSEKWAIYRVRRIYSAKGRADRAVEKIKVFDREAEARLELNRLSDGLGIAVEASDGFSYVWRERRADEYPTREDFLTIAPARVETKARYGLPWFEQRWVALQLQLF